MISKQMFVDIIDEMEREQDRQYDLNVLYGKYVTQSNVLESSLVSCVVELLGEIFNNQDIIECWIYQLNFGRECDNNNNLLSYLYKVKEDISTPELFYDFLVKNK